MLSMSLAPSAAEQHLAVLGVFQCVRKQVADHLLEQTRIAVDRKAARDHAQGKPLCLRMIGEFVPQPLKQIVDREIDYFGVDGAGLDLVDVEQRVQHARHGAQRLVEPRDQLLRLFSFDRSSPSKPCSRARVCSGWRRSWLAAARKRDFATLASSACRLAASSASAVRRRSVMSAKVMTTPSTPLSWVR